MGAILMLLSLSIGLAAYNSSSNILFITLSLLLSSIILSGVLSWYNLRQLEAELLPGLTARALEPCAVGACVHNPRSGAAAWSLWCEFSAVPAGLPVTLQPEVLQPRTRRGIRQRLAAVDALNSIGRTPLPGPVETRSSQEITWLWTPPMRGAWTISLDGLGSKFPFGFLRKVVALRSELVLIVRPAAITYQKLHDTGVGGLSGGSRSKVRGDGVDLAGLRRYQEGDSHRLVHWKASARQRQLLVRINSDERHANWCLRLDPGDPHWRDPAQFEKAVSFAACLAAALHQQGTLHLLHLGGTPPVRVRGSQDLETWLDLLACVVLPREAVGSDMNTGRLSELDIVPEGPNGVAAVHHGEAYYIA